MKMKTVFRREMKEGGKNLLIWTLSIGLLGFFCTVLYSDMSGMTRDMTAMFANMGAFSKAFGITTLGLETMAGYFAVEAGTIHGLGSALYAAMTATVLLSNEEDRHTGEFLFSLPVARGKIVTAKMLSLLTRLVILTTVCGLIYEAGFLLVGEGVPVKEFISWLLAELLMNIEISAVCLAVSAFGHTNRTGLGLGIALLFYGFDKIGRITEELEKILFIGPFSYAEAADVFAGNGIPVKAAVFAAAVTAATVLLAILHYRKKDLAA